MSTIDTKTLGMIEMVTPSLSTCFDLVSMWSGVQNNRSTMGRICAIAICVCGDDPRLPKKRHIVETVEFGSECLDYLLGAGVTVDEILQNGVQCIGYMAKSLPSNIEVEETENFIEQPNPAA